MKLKGKTSLAYRKQDGYKDIEIYENYFLLHKSVIATFESTFIPHLYNEFCAYLEHKFEEKWTWDADTKIKAQGLYAPCSSFEHMLLFLFFLMV